jgi:hypothetical protein
MELASESLEKAIAMKVNALEFWKSKSVSSNAAAAAVAAQSLSSTLQQTIAPSITVDATQVANWQRMLDTVQRELEKAEPVINNVFSQSEHMREKLFQSEKWKTFIKGKRKSETTSYQFAVDNSSFFY